MIEYTYLEFPGSDECLVFFELTSKPGGYALKSCASSFITGYYTSRKIYQIMYIVTRVLLAFELERTVGLS
jgi:hypothetical protein